MKIIIYKPDQTAHEVVIHENFLFIGRSRQNDVVLDDPRVSRKHAKVFFDSGKWFLEDLKSDNGTRYKEEKIQRVSILSGEPFHIGPFTLELKAELHKPLPREAPPTTPTTISHLDESALEETELLGALPQQDPNLKNVDPLTGKTEVNSAPAMDASQTELDLDGLPKASQPSIDTNPSATLKENPSLAHSLPNNVVPFPTFRSDPSFTNDQDQEDTKLDHTAATLAEVDAISVSQIDSTSALSIEPHQFSSRLVRLDGEHVGEEIKLTKTEVSLGNHPEADILIETQDDLPTNKAILAFDGETFVVKNESESTGTFIDGTLIKEHRLKNHEILQVGNSHFEFLASPQDQPRSKPKVVERASKGTPGLLWIWQDYRKMALCGFILGSCFAYLANRQNTPPSVPQNQTQMDGQETERIALFHLSQAQDLISQNKLDDAQARIRLVLDLNPHHEDAQKLQKKIFQMREENKLKTRVKRIEVANTQTQIVELLSEAKRLKQENKVESSKILFQKVLGLDPQNAEAIEALKDLEKPPLSPEDIEREKMAQLQETQQLEKMYTQGVNDFEAGNFVMAEKILKVVASKPQHPNHESAKNLIQEIEKRRTQDIDSKLAEVKQLIAKEQVENAFRVLKELDVIYPKHPTVQSTLKEYGEKMETLSREAYREGITLLEVANDPAGAVEKFEKAARLSPPGSEYGKKAKAKIKELQM